MVILDGLLEQHTSLRPTTLVTDSASYSDIVFGLFTLLGYLASACGSLISVRRASIASTRPPTGDHSTALPVTGFTRISLPQLGRSAACSRLTQARLCGRPRSDAHLPGQRSKLHPGAGVG